MKLLCRSFGRQSLHLAAPLYWEDVKVGTYPTATVDGPVMESVMPTQPYGMGTGGSKTLKAEIMDPETFKTLVKDENGIYLTKDKEGYVPTSPGTAGGRGGEPPDGMPEGMPPGGMSRGGGQGSGDIDTTLLHQSKESERSVLFNFMGRDFAIRHINNWMGDLGWVNIRWSITAPSSLEAVGLNVPDSPFFSGIKIGRSFRRHPLRPFHPEHLEALRKQIPRCNGMEL